ncbi:MAG: protein kinase, partial [Candidatus Aminicenantales bacterium]
MKCPECHFENPETTRFCGNCGTRLISKEKISVSPTKTQPTPREELKIGTTFAGRYQIIEELGKGGMGRVYKVMDREIKENLALKLLNPEISANEKVIERFRNELKFARKISHRNVCRMYDLGDEQGTRYITMEYVSGEDLKSSIRRMGPLSIGKAISIAKQICEGLAEAHRLGVIHRDLKTRNIMIDRDGNTRIMDFGIARSLEEEGITDTGVMIGTPKYMPPEQVEGKKVDERSDIYSLGVILYEMVTGKVPFEGDTALSVALKQKTEAPLDPMELNPLVPVDLNRVIMKCLEKQKERRFQTAEELISALDQVEKEIPTEEGKIAKRMTEWSKERRKRMIAVPLIFLIIAAAMVGGYFLWKQQSLTQKPAEEYAGRITWEHSIAVLPVEDLSPERDQAPLCEGMHDDIITKLSSIEDLRVAPKLSVVRYKDTKKDIREIGKELQVESILVLTLQREGNIIRVNGRLHDTKGGFPIRTYRFERNFDGYFKMQDEISDDIARTLEVQPEEERLRAIKRREHADVAAYEYYVKGNYYEGRYSDSYDEEDFQLALRMLRKTTEVAPDYALAYWSLGNLYEARFVDTDNRQFLDQMLKNYEKAFEIDPDLAEAHLGLGWGFFYKEDLDRAYQSFKRAFEIEPQSLSINFDVAGFYKSIGLFDQAIPFYLRAIQIDPTYVMSYDILAACYMYVGEYTKAIDCLKKALGFAPKDYGLHLNYARQLILMGRYDEAEEKIDQAEEIRPG